MAKSKSGKSPVDGKVKVGIIGCGNICDIYFKRTKIFQAIEVAACADLMPERAKAKADEYGCQAVTVKQLLDDQDIQIVLNLTIPKAHAEVATAAIQAGKSVYNEKPLAITRQDGQSMLALAKSNGVRIGCAPDTFLGGGMQT
ncbi:MAG: gfo/Idh/MocA family oxidoreductase, partial [Planctomycetaceae bacterium]